MVLATELGNEGDTCVGVWVGGKGRGGGATRSGSCRGKSLKDRVFVCERVYAEEFLFFVQTEG